MMGGGYFMAGGTSIWHWFFALIWILVIGWPVFRILSRLGFSGWWAILAFVPFINLIGLWVVAVVDWPTHKRNVDSEPR